MPPAAANPVTAFIFVISAGWALAQGMLKHQHHVVDRSSTPSAPAASAPATPPAEDSGCPCPALLTDEARRFILQLKCYAQIGRRSGYLCGPSTSRRKMSSSKKKASSRPRRARQDDACPACGTLLRKTRGKLRLPVHGEEMTVPNALHLACPKCGEVVLRPADVRRLRERAHSRERAITFGEAGQLGGCKTRASAGLTRLPVRVRLDVEALAEQFPHCLFFFV